MKNDTEEQREGSSRRFRFPFSIWVCACITKAHKRSPSVFGWRSMRRKRVVAVKSCVCKLWMCTPRTSATVNNSQCDDVCQECVREEEKEASEYADGGWHKLLWRAVHQCKSHNYEDHVCIKCNQIATVTIAGQHLSKSAAHLNGT